MRYNDAGAWRKVISFLYFNMAIIKLSVGIVCTRAEVEEAAVHTDSLGDTMKPLFSLLELMRVERERES